MTLFAKVTFDGSGTPTLVTSETILGPQNPTTINPSNGIASFTRVSTGVFDIVLQDPYVRLLQVGLTSVGMVEDPLTVVVATETVNDNTAPTISIATLGVLSQYNAGPPPSVNSFPVPKDCIGPGYVLFQITLANSTAL